MSNPTIGDKLALTGKVMELKLGKSFDSGVNQHHSQAFHTFRYDFKPASVDTSQMACVDVEQRHQISVTVPHHDSSASTVFRGSQRPYQKECVLIIDHRTGEATLERLSCNVQLKKTRAEGSSKVSLGAQPGVAGSGSTAPVSLGRPLTPSAAQQQGSQLSLDGDRTNTDRVEALSGINSKLKRPSPPIASQRAHACSPVSAGGGSSGSGGGSNSKQRISPVAGGSLAPLNSAGVQQQSSSSSARQQQGSKGSSPGSSVTSASSRRTPSALSANSMPMLLDDSGRFDDTGLNLQQAQPLQNNGLPTTGGGGGVQFGRPAGTSTTSLSGPGHQPSMPMLDSNTDVVEMSEGSSSMSSSSGSSSEGSDSESESDAAQPNSKRRSGCSRGAPSVPTLPATNTSSGSTYGASHGTLHPPSAVVPSVASSTHQQQQHHHPVTANAKGSMPKLSQLSEDLQLSESGSDSD